MADNKIPEDHPLYKKFKEALNITSDMRPGPNPFVVKCIEIAEEYAHDQMRWVKASDELPERKGEYFIIRDDYKSVAMFDGEKFYGNDNWIDVKLWLYEPEKPQP